MLDALVLPSIPRAEDLATAASVTFSIRVCLALPASYSNHVHHMQTRMAEHQQQFFRAVGIYAVSYVFSMSASAPADTWLRQFWWISFFVATLPPYM